jgi:hypothetical protein
VIGEETGVLNLYVSSNIMSSNIFGDVTTQPKYEVKIGIILSQEMNNKKTKRDKMKLSTEERKENIKRDIVII